MLDFDREVSRLHAAIERVGAAWMLIDDGFSTNGTFLNGEEPVRRVLLSDGAFITMGQTTLQYRAPSDRQSEPTRPRGVRPSRPSCTARAAACWSSFAVRSRGSRPGAPATNREIAASLIVSLPTVKAHVRQLAQQFGVAEEPQNRKRLALAQQALRVGSITERDLSG